MSVLLSVSIVFDTRNEWVHIFQLENGNISRRYETSAYRTADAERCVLAVTSKGNPSNRNYFFLSDDWIKVKVFKNITLRIALHLSIEHGYFVVSFDLTSILTRSFEFLRRIRKIRKIKKTISQWFNDVSNYIKNFNELFQNVFDSFRNILFRSNLNFDSILRIFTNEHKNS